jgi:hypothetical protein
MVAPESRRSPLRSLRRSYRAWRAARSPAIPLASLAPGVRARIEGIVEPGDAQVISPFTQRQGVLAQVVLREKQLDESRQGDVTYTWFSQVREQLTAPFWIVDDAGSRAFVDPEHALIELPLEDVREHPRVNDGNPDLARYLRAHGVMPTRYMGIAGEHRFLEVVLAAGARVALSGVPRMCVMHVPALARASYRDAPIEVPTFSDAPDEPLVILSPRG